MENKTVGTRVNESNVKNRFTTWRVVQLGILGTFVGVFFALFALSPANVFGIPLDNGYSVLKYYSGDIELIDMLLEDINPIMLTIFIMNIIILLRIALTAILPIFTLSSERRIGKLFYGVPIAEYVAFIILSIGLMIKISLAELTIGTFPILLLVFSTVCILVSVITIIIMYIQKYGKTNSSSSAEVADENLHCTDNSTQNSQKQLTIEAFIWIFDAAFIIAAIIMVCI